MYPSYITTVLWYEALTEENFQYLHQIDTRVIVMDILEMVGYNITLEQLSNYRGENLAVLPEHDLAILIRYGYEGGIAYVNGICGRSAVGITGVSNVLELAVFKKYKIVT